MESIQRFFNREATLPMMDLGLLRYSIKLDIAPYSISELVLQTLRSINTTTLVLLSFSFILLVSSVSSVLLIHRLNTQEGRGRRPPQVPYTVPVVGNLLTFLRVPHHLAASITQVFGKSGVVRLDFFTNDVYVVSGSDYLKAVWKDTKGMSSCDGLNVALRNMFNTPRKDMAYIKKDRSGISHDPHPRSDTKPENRVFHHAFKATADYLTGPHMLITARNFQRAMQKRISMVPIQDRWTEMDDLLGFLRPLIAQSTVEAICGQTFVKRYPNFVENFYEFNGKVHAFLYGWPGFFMPKASRARERCISVLKDWRATTSEKDFDGNGMMTARWRYFSKMSGMSDYGVACQDLGILWGMFSNSMPSGFWLFWHALQDQSLMADVASEISGCRIPYDGRPSDAFLDTKQITNQPLLQSLFAETLRKYAAVYITRTTEFQDAQVLDYRIPKGKMVIINSNIAHMDERNWNTGANGEHPVTSFWGERFLTNSTEMRSCITPSEGTDSGYASGTEYPFEAKVEVKKFSLDRYKGAWVPFGGGFHMCPGRHWVKTQMLLSFAMITSAFEFELLDAPRELAVDNSRYGLGALYPGEKARFRIRRNPVVA